MSSKDSHLYQQRPANIRGGKPISSNNSLSFTSSLSSLINNSSTTSDQSSQSRRKAPKSAHLKPKKDDIFHKPNRHTSKRAKLDLEQESSTSTPGEQKHTTNGESLDRSIWERSQKKMQEKARLYAAMKRGDVEDVDERYGVDFDRKWAQEQEEGKGKEGSESEDLSEDEKSNKEEEEAVEYTDEFGRTRKGTRADLARLNRISNARSDLESDRYTSRPSAPSTSNIIRGDTIQHQAFKPDDIIAEQMEALAKKRDRSLTPPEERHFDSRREVRQHGTGFFQFSAETEERKRQMDDLERQREETERVRREKARGRANEFLEELGEEMGGAT